MLFRLTWKERVTPSGGGFVRCGLRGAAHPVKTVLRGRLHSGRRIPMRATTNPAADTARRDGVLALADAEQSERRPEYQEHGNTHGRNRLGRSGATGDVGHAEIGPRTGIPTGRKTRIAAGGSGVPGDLGDAAERGLGMCGSASGERGRVHSQASLTASGRRRMALVPGPKVPANSIHL